MCTGLEIAAVVGALTAVTGAAVSIHGQEVQKNQAQANAQHAADQAEADAAARKGAAEVEAERIRRAAKQQRGKAVAAAAASGVDISSPTALKIDQEIYENAEHDAQFTLMQGVDAAARIKQQGQAELVTAQAYGNAMDSKQLGTLISAAGQTAGYYDQWKRAS